MTTAIAVTKAAQNGTRPKQRRGSRGGKSKEKEIKPTCGHPNQKRDVSEMGVPTKRKLVLKEGIQSSFTERRLPLATLQPTSSRNA